MIINYKLRYHYWLQLFATHSLSNFEISSLGAVHKCMFISSLVRKSRKSFNIGLTLILIMSRGVPHIPTDCCTGVFYLCLQFLLLMCHIIHQSIHFFRQSHKINSAQPSRTIQTLYGVLFTFSIGGQPNG